MIKAVAVWCCRLLAVSSGQLHAWQLHAWQLPKLHAGLAGVTRITFVMCWIERVLHHVV
jgi:hypothetical protein